MNKSIKALIIFLCFICVLIVVMSCKGENKTPVKDLAITTVEETTTRPKHQLSQNFKDYWYAGQAEITSYQLEQVRYGEIRQGTAVLVYVTEDFLEDKQVKADAYNSANIPVLKLNATKNFNTGIYPYSIMQSTFYPVSNNNHAIKVTASVQEWCGHVYAQLNNRNKFEVMSHSYFQGEADQNFSIDKTYTENELWTKLRINPNSLPTGDLSIIPLLEYTRLNHKPIKAYEANAVLQPGKYILNYPELKRSLTLNFNPEFPYDIIGWEETMSNGYGDNAKVLTTKATKLEQIRSAYWNKNSNVDEGLRKKLKLQ